MSLGSLGQVSYDLVADDQTSGPVGSASGSLEGLTVTLGDVRDALQTISGVMEGAAKGYANVESYSARLSHTTGLTAQETRNLINEFWNVTDPLNEAGGMLLELAKNGVTTSDEFQRLGTQFANFGDSVNMSAEIAVAKFMPALRSLKVPSDEVGSALDKISYLTANYSVDANQLSNILVRMGGEMGRYGLSVDDVAASVMVLAEQGVSGREMLRMFSAAMSDSTDTNKDGNISQEELAAALGITVGELEAASQALDAATGHSEEYAEATNKAYTPLESLNQEVDEFVANLGPLPALVSLVAGPLSTVADVLLVLAAVKMAGLSTGLLTVASSLKVVGVAGIAAGAGLMTALIPLLPILAGLALGLAAVWVMNELGVFDWIIQAGKDFGEFISGVGPAFVDWITGLPDAVGGAIGGVVGWFDDLYDSLTMTFWSIPETISDAFSSVLDTITSTLAGIPGALGSAFSGIAEAFSALGGRVQEAFSNLFGGIGEFIVGMAQGFISAGYNIIMYIVQGMKDAAGAVGEAIGGILGFLSQFLPHSPAEIGPLSKLPDFGAYLVEPLRATLPDAQAASAEIAEAIAMPAAQPSAMGGGTNIGYQDNSAPISVDSINASSDYPIDKIMADIAAMQAQKRTQKGYGV